MSAIAGVLQFHGKPVAAGLLERVTSHMVESGPDGASHWYRGGVALGHRFLRIGASPARPQPLENAAGTLCAVMDGWLGDREQLRSELQHAGISQRLVDDADLLLHAYSVWGPACTTHLRGEFAFAIWDARSGRLFCTVDSFAARQLYYVHKAGFFAFASTEEALSMLPEVSAEPSDDMIARLLVPDLPPLDLAASWLRDVRTLRPAQSVEVNLDGRVRFETYWRLRAPASLHRLREEDAHAQFLQLFEHAVRQRTADVERPSLMLSGGMDSASIRAMLGRTSRGSTLRTYSVVSDAPADCEESQSILHLSRGAEAHLVSVPSLRGSITAEELVREAWNGAHPRDNSLLLPALVCLAARRNEDRVMLHGVSGDSTLRVPTRYPARLLQAGFARQAWHECVHASLNNTYLRGQNPLALFLANAWTAWTPGHLKSIAQPLWRPSRGTGRIRISPEFERKLGIHERLRARSEAAARSRRMATTEPEDLIESLYGANGLALGLCGFGQLGQRYGMELRDPWADRAIVEFMLALPLQQKIRDGWNKYFVRAALRSQLDGQVLWRTDKDHLGWLFTRRLLKESRPLLDDAFGRDLSIAAPYIDIGEARGRYHNYLAGDDSDQPEALTTLQYVYDVAVLIEWLKRLARSGNLL